MDNDPIRTAGRETRRLERLGSGPLVCILCGYTDPVALIPVSKAWLQEHGVPRSLLEDHPFYGENHDPEATVLICRNCHAVVHEGLLQAGVSLLPEPDPVARVALMLDAEAVFFEALAAAKRRSAKILRDVVRKEPVQ